MTGNQKLIYYPDSRPGIGRRRCGRGFAYFAPDGTHIDRSASRDRFRKLAVPPAYEEVWISPHANGHLQATGRDVKARKQYLYHPDWTVERARRKFDRLAEFGEALPKLRRRIAAGLRAESGDLELAVAAALALVDRASLRIGGVDYARENGSYGVTTLLSRHLRLKDDAITLSFKGKGGARVRQELRGPRLNRALHKVQDLPGAELFSWTGDDGESHVLRSEQINREIAETCGEGMSAKTFRTWNGTHAAFCVAFKAEDLTIATMADVAAERLDNTPAIARGSYIHPKVIGLAGLTADERAALANSLTSKTTTGLRSGEAQLIDFLRS